MGNMSPTIRRIHSIVCYRTIVLLIVILVDDVISAPKHSQKEHTMSAISARSAQSDHLAYANFHADFRIINLAADLSYSVPRKFYFKDCTENQYLNWYLNDYPPDCQFRFSNATSLRDLLNIYCDAVCGEEYFKYITRCGETAKEMVQYYKSLCRRQDETIKH